ncbi:hypothetical protein [Streptomyces monashensis]|uniref:Uncharacterized protein n=1 Tax=Streptomyces monashensis TaxID=1678012 RepID=A0A1S2PVD5_9ACTN|nr:hypothetical protein [Streptomyces monashensis]OIJ97355.1 hypothetical protein BIV23_31325 [Streptomyces monashensis]
MRAFEEEVRIMSRPGASLWLGAAIVAVVGAQGHRLVGAVLLVAGGASVVMICFRRSRLPLGMSRSAAYCACCHLRFRCDGTVGEGVGDDRCEAGP